VTVPEATLVETEHGLVPRGEGWFVLNARDAAWERSERNGEWCTFEGDVRFAQLGINLNVLQPGQPVALYHAEETQEGFLVLAGEAVLIVEDEERPLRAWDFFHCPANTAHVMVAAGDGPFVFIGVGARREGRGIVYPASEVAARHNASVAKETTSGQEAYAGFPEVTPVRPPALPW
jgi:uncharacterized cupin superfamily protein